MTSWLIYALGGGLGHVTRSLALARAAQRAGRNCTLVCNSSLLASIKHAGKGSSIIALDSELGGPAVAQRLRELARTLQPDRLIVDTFPRGLGGELIDILPSVDCPKVLVHRDLNPQYVESFQLAEFTARNYDLVLAPGEEPTLLGLKNVVRTAPWLSRDADELQPRDAARCQMQAEADARPIVLVIATGRPSEIVEMHVLADQLAIKLHAEVLIRVASLSEPHSASLKSMWIQAWPLLPLLTGVDLVLGAGGYNTVHEAQAVGVPLLGIARPRLYDRQDHRLGKQAVSNDVEAIVDRIRITLSTRCSPLPPRYENGAHHAVATIAQAR